MSSTIARSPAPRHPSSPNGRSILPGRPYTNKEVALVRQCADEGLSISRTVIVLALNGYTRTKSGVQSASKTYEIYFHGELGPPRGNKNRLGKINRPRLPDEIRKRNSDKARAWRKKHPDYSSLPHVKKASRAANKRYRARKSQDIAWKLMDQERHRQY